MSENTSTADLSPLELVRGTLGRILRDRLNLQPHVQAFMVWVDSDLDPSSTELARLSQEATEYHGPAFTYQHVGVLGYGADGAALDERGTAVLSAGLEWLAARQWFVPGRVPTFEADGVALLGVTLGILRLSESEQRTRLMQWMDGLLTGVGQIVEEGTWEHGLVEAAHLLISSGQEPVNNIATIPLELSAALAKRGRVFLPAEAEHDALSQIFTSVVREEIEPERAAVQHAALHWLFRAAPTVVPTRANPHDVVRVLEGIARSMRRWTWEEKPPKRNTRALQWPILHEYHVQNLLWTVLAPLFPDLDDEEYLRSLGHKHPRADLAIPSLKLIVEAKFIYRGDQPEFADMIGQIGEDASLYLADETKYSMLIPFIWDHSAHVEEHAELRQGLLRIRGVIGAVIIPRPGKMQALS